MFELHIEKLERTVLGCLLEVIVEYCLVQTEEHVSLASKQNHFKVFQVSQKEHPSVHHVQQTLVDKLVLVLHYRYYALLDCKSDRNIKHVVF